MASSTGGRLSGKVVFITGAAQGIGRASALVSLRMAAELQCELRRGEAVVKILHTLIEMSQRGCSSHSHGHEWQETGGAEARAASHSDRRFRRHSSRGRGASLPGEVQ